MVEIIERLFAAANKVVRPYLTLFITTLYNVLLAGAVMTNHLTVRDYIVAIGPTNAMILGFWFAEKAALKNPKADDAGDTES